MPPIKFSNTTQGPAPSLLERFVTPIPAAQRMVQKADDEANQYDVPTLNRSEGDAWWSGLKAGAHQGAARVAAGFSSPAGFLSLLGGMGSEGAVGAGFNTAARALKAGEIAGNAGFGLHGAGKAFNDINDPNKNWGDVGGDVAEAAQGLMGAVHGARSYGKIPSNPAGPAAPPRPKMPTADEIKTMREVEKAHGVANDLRSKEEIAASKAQDEAAAMQNPQAEAQNKANILKTKEMKRDQDWLTSVEKWKKEQDDQNAALDLAKERKVGLEPQTPTVTESTRAKMPGVAGSVSSTQKFTPKETPTPGGGDDGELSDLEQLLSGDVGKPIEETGLTRQAPVQGVVDPIAQQRAEVAAYKNALYRRHLDNGETPVNAQKLANAGTPPPPRKPQVEEPSIEGEVVQPPQPELGARPDHPPNITMDQYMADREAGTGMTEDDLPGESLGAGRGTYVEPPGKVEVSPEVPQQLEDLKNLLTDKLNKTAGAEPEAPPTPRLPYKAGKVRTPAQQAQEDSYQELLAKLEGERSPAPSESPGEPPVTPQGPSEPISDTERGVLNRLGYSDETLGRITPDQARQEMAKEMEVNDEIASGRPSAPQEGPSEPVTEPGREPGIGDSWVRAHPATAPGETNLSGGYTPKPTTPVDRGDYYEQHGRMASGAPQEGPLARFFKSRVDAAGQAHRSMKAAKEAGEEVNPLARAYTGVSLENAGRAGEFARFGKPGEIDPALDKLRKFLEIDVTRDINKKFGGNVSELPPTSKTKPTAPPQEPVTPGKGGVATAEPPKGSGAPQGGPDWTKPEPPLTGQALADFFLGRMGKNDPHGVAYDLASGQAMTDPEGKPGAPQDPMAGQPNSGKGGMAKAQAARAKQRADAKAALEANKNDPSQKGSVDPGLLMALARMGAGGLAGGVAGGQVGHPYLGAIAGAGLGAVTGEDLSPEALQSVKEPLVKGMEVANRVHNAALLSPLSVAKKALGDFGGLSAAALENPHQAGALLKALTTGMPEAYQAGKAAFNSPYKEMEPLTGAESMIANGPMSWPGRTMAGLTAGTKNLMEQGGFSPEQQKKYTMTAEPDYGLTKGLLRMQRSSKLVQHLSPFARITVNRLEGGWKRSPFGMPSAIFSKNPEIAKNALRLGAMGTTAGALAAALTPKDFATDHPVEAGLIAAAMGPYGIPVGVGMASQSMAKSSLPGMARIMTQDIPGLRSIEDFSRSPVRMGENYLSGYTNQLAPLAKFLSPNEPDTSQHFYDRALSNIPGERERLPSKALPARPGRLKFSNVP